MSRVLVRISVNVQIDGSTVNYKNTREDYDMDTLHL